jgi:hypothetical protein
VKPIQRPKATTAIQIDNDSAPAVLAANGTCAALPQRPMSRPTKKMKGRHVDAGEGDQDHLPQKEEIVAVGRGIRSKQQRARDRGNDERSPREREHVTHETADRTIERGHAQEPQIDDRDRADHQCDCEHVDGFDPREQRLVLPDGCNRRATDRMWTVCTVGTTQLVAWMAWLSAV